MPIKRLGYLVGIPVPYRDRRGHRLPSRERREWTRKTQELLTGCFGGSTLIPAPGMNVVQGDDGQLITLYENGQTLVLAACTTRGDFIRRQSQIASFAEMMATALDQESVFVLAFPSDSFLVEGRYVDQLEDGGDDNE